MEKFEELLKSYGLELMIPGNPRLLYEELKDYRKNEKATAYGLVMLLLLNDVRFEIKNADLLFQKLKVPKRYEKIAGICENKMSLQIWEERERRKKMLNFVTEDYYENHLEKLEKELKENPNKYILESDEEKLLRMFDVSYSKDRAVKMLDLYYELLNETNEYILEEKDNFIKKIKQSLKGKKIDERWLKEKIKGWS